MKNVALNCDIKKNGLRNLILFYLCLVLIISSFKIKFKIQNLLQLS